MAISPRLLKNKTLASKIRQNESLVAKLTGKGVQTFWDLDTDYVGAPLVMLELHNQSRGQSRYIFSPWDFDRPTFLKQSIDQMKDMMESVTAWRDRLDALFDKLMKWSAHLPATLRVVEQPIDIFEPRTGRYQVRQLVITDVQNVVHVRPKGFWYIGTEGMVTMEGSGIEFTLAHSAADGGWVWLRDSPYHDSVPLTQKLFLELVQDCLE